MKLGYARASTTDPNANSQVAILQSEGCDEIVVEHSTGGRWDTPKLKQALTRLQPNDVIVVLSIASLGRSLVDVLITIQKFIDKKIVFASINDQLDTRTPEGQKVVSIFASFSELRKSKISETTREGLEKARRNGHAIGRPPKLGSIEKTRIAHLIKMQVMSKSEIARMYKVDPSVISRISKTTELTKT